MTREKLIYYMQNIGSPDLLPSPSELILNYMKAGCPIVEPPYKLLSMAPIADIWRDICEHTEKTFVLDLADLQNRTKIIRELFMTGVRMVLEPQAPLPKVGPKSEKQEVIEQVVGKLKGVRYYDLPERERKKIIIAYTLTMILIVSGFDFDNAHIEKFWQEKHQTVVRMDFLFRNYEQLFYQGPTFLAAEMILSQLEIGGKRTRGLLWDALHSIYLVYTDIFLTTDAHFKKIRETNPHPTIKRITYLPDIIHQFNVR